MVGGGWACGRGAADPGEDLGAGVDERLGRVAQRLEAQRAQAAPAARERQPGGAALPQGPPGALRVAAGAGAGRRQRRAAAPRAP